MRSGPADYLMVVDANVGYNKASGRIREAFDLQRGSCHAGRAARYLTLTHTHTSVVPAACVPEARYDPTYDQMMDRCYWDYLQVFVPKDHRLQDATAIPVPADEVFSRTAESGRVSVGPVANGPWQAWGVLAVLAPGTAQTRTYTLTLSAEAVQWHGNEGYYGLRLQKQPGASPRPLSLRVRIARSEHPAGLDPGSQLPAGWLARLPVDAGPRPGCGYPLQEQRMRKTVYLAAFLIILLLGLSGASDLWAAPGQANPTVPTRTPTPGPVIIVPTTAPRPDAPTETPRPDAPTSTSASRSRTATPASR